jgi:hypothetical protein
MAQPNDPGLRASFEQTARRSRSRLHAYRVIEMSQSTWLVADGVPKLAADEALGTRTLNKTRFRTEIAFYITREINHII